MKRRRRLTEDADWHILRNPAPFRIGRAPEPIYNDDSKLKINYLLRRAEEIATFREQARVVGQMEQIKPMLADLYRDITTIRNFVKGQESEPLATEKHIATMEKMISAFDKMNGMLTDEIFALCDDLIVDERVSDGGSVDDNYFGNVR